MDLNGKDYKAQTGT
jgi:NO-binding membrane sensor protein with MHYT domain